MNDTPTPPAPASGKPDKWVQLATWFGCGLSPVMSGTVGSLGALPFAFVIQYLLGNFALFVAACAIFYVGVIASNEYLRQTGRDDDPSEIVIDEVAGMWLLLAFLPFSWNGYIAGFILFRAFDIVKPWPISVADETIKGGFGVMFDDILAAIYPVVIFNILLLLGYCFGFQKYVYSWLYFLT